MVLKVLDSVERFFMKTEQADILSRIAANEFTSVPTDKELAVDLEATTPEELQRALEDAQDKVTALTDELDKLPERLRLAQQRERVAEHKKLLARQEELPELILHAQIAELDARQAILDVEMPVLRAAHDAAAALYPQLDKAIKLATVARSSAEQRAHIVGVKMTNNRADHAAQERRKAEIRALWFRHSGK